MVCRSISPSDRVWFDTIVMLYSGFLSCCYFIVFSYVALSFSIVFMIRLIRCFVFCSMYKHFIKFISIVIFHTNFFRPLKTKPAVMCILVRETTLALGVIGAYGRTSSWAHRSWIVHLFQTYSVIQGIDTSFSEDLQYSTTVSSR